MSRLAAAVKSGLVRWGEWQSRVLETHGYPPSSSTGRIFEGGTRPRPGDRVLIPDMPEDVARIHAAWRELREIYRTALFGKYALCMKEDGTLLTDREVARMIGIPRDTFRSRVRQARSMIATRISSREE